jgi:adenylylsulfate kinase
MTKDIVWHEELVDRQDRNRRNKHKSGVVWFTGCPASGKSTIAHHMAKEFFDRGVNCYVLDGDNVRHGINSDLGFSREDRRQNLRRIAEISKLFVDAGMVVLAAFVSPFCEDRDTVRQIVGTEFFFEVYVKCSIETCEKRDPKGQYKKARAGLIKEYTGVSAPYEEPQNPEIILDTEELDVESSVKKVLEFLDQKKFILLM